MSTRRQVIQTIAETVCQVIVNTLVFLIMYFLLPQDSRLILLLVYLFRISHYLSDGHQKLMWLARFQEAT